jgi:DNA-binding IclR family transcriptional regulator
MSTGPSPSMIERMTSVLDAFENPSARLSLEQVTAHTLLPRSTAHRILVHLVQLSWLRRTADGYALGARPLAFGHCDHSHIEVRQLAAPHLHDLQLRTGMVVHLAVLQGADVHYLDKAGGRFATSVPSRVGGRAPAHGTGLGKAILAWLPAEQVDDLVGPRLGRMTDRTIADLAVLHQELHRVRQRNGLAFERGECFPEISCVASAIRGEDGPVASISLVGPVRTPLEKVAPLVADATQRISRQLLHRVAPPDQDGAERAQTWSRQTFDHLLATGYGDWM